ncbi:MAG: hypothetical protein PHC83_00810 [Bacteroidales bacterium]|nr:hypothetical protein [Bacteroidales bacterium]
MKKIRIIIAVLFVVTMGVGVFIACEKETKSLEEKNNNKIITIQKEQGDDGHIEITVADHTTAFNTESNDCEGPGNQCAAEVTVTWVCDDCQVPPDAPPVIIIKLDEIHQAYENNNYEEIINIITENRVLLSEIIADNLLGQTINEALNLSINAVYITDEENPENNSTRYVIIFNDAITDAFYTAVPINYNYNLSSN